MRGTGAAGGGPGVPVKWTDLHFNRNEVDRWPAQRMGDQKLADTDIKERRMARFNQLLKAMAEGEAPKRKAVESERNRKDEDRPAR